MDAAGPTGLTSLPEVQIYFVKGNSKTGYIQIHSLSQSQLASWVPSCFIVGFHNSHSRREKQPRRSTMGNTLRLLYSGCCKPCVAGGSDSGGSHAVSALARDLLYFAITSQVPEGLSNRVVSSKKAQANWYRNLLLAWKESKPPPRTPEQASTLVLLTLEKRQKADVEGFLAFYGLPLPHTLLGITAGVPAQVSQTVQFELQTRPVDPRAVTDGDSITAYVSTSDPRESSSVPQEVLVATIKRSEARAVRNYDRADALHETIIESGYRMFRDQNKEVLARKYRIQLRGIDAPEISMPYGQEAMEELKRIIGGHPLRVLVYGEDQYHRLVGDVYCNGKFVQELMLKRGMAWHYTAFDQRPKLAKWEKKARVKRVGLWASSNPEKPWEWRKNNLSEGR